MKEEWELACSKAPPHKVIKQASMEPSTSDSSEQQDSDTYCFELLSMLTGLSQSEVGCGFLAEQNKLIQDLFTLLPVASLRIQLQEKQQTYRILFDKPVMLMADHWYVAYASVSSPSGSSSLLTRMKSKDRRVSGIP